MGAASDDKILYEPGEHHLTIRFNRPEFRNPLSIDVLEELQNAIENVSARNEIRAIVFTGTGDVFASGADLKEIAGVTAETARKFALRGQKLMNAIAAAPQRTIAAVNGYCFGGALDLALSCDTRIASPNAIFCHPGVGLGIITGWSGTQRLPRLIGEAKALEMFLSARQVDAGQALEMGLIESVSENLTEEIAELCKTL